MINWILVFVGGGIGSMTRYGISRLLSGQFQGSFPLATFLSNVFSTILLAFLVSYSIKSGAVEHRWVKMGLIVGFCGGFSTFSTFSYETMLLMKNGNHLVAVGNMIISVGFCLILLFKLTK